MMHLRDRSIGLAVWALMLFSGSSGWVCAQVSDKLIAPAGLEIQWENSLGGAGLAHGEQSFTVWPHATERREYVDVFLGSRLLERIDARQVDRAAVDRLILEGKPLRPMPTLGLEGAKARADQLAKTYAVLGKQLTIKTFSEPVIYVVAATSNGIISAIDGESGEVLWQSTVPNANLPIYGPGVSDDYVTVVNGNSFYAMELKTGNLVNTARLNFTPTSAPIPMAGRMMVPSIEGRIVGYDMEKPLIAPVVLRSGTENRNGLAVSAARDFIAWTTESSLVLVHNENVPKLWSRVNAGEACESHPVTTSQGFVFCTNYGSVIHATLNRVGSYSWRANLALPTSLAPVVSREHVFVISDDGRVDALDLATGKQVWAKRANNVNRILGVGKEHLYVRDTRGMLASLRISDGEFAARTNSLLQGLVPNSVHDRFFVVTRDGHVSCLREKGAVKPTMFVDVQAVEPEKKPGKTAPSPNAPANRRAEEDVFGAGDRNGGPPAGGDAKDPFDPF